MTFDEFKTLVGERTDFTDREVTLLLNIEFTTLESWIKQLDYPSFKLMSYLAYHKDCTVEVFTKIYEKHMKLFHISGKVFRQAYVFKNIEAVALVLDCEPNRNAINAAFMNGTKNWATSDNLIKNKRINGVFKSIYGVYYYRTFGDEKYLPQALIDNFIF